MKHRHDKFLIFKRLERNIDTRYKKTFKMPIKASRCVAASCMYKVTLSKLFHRLF